MALEDNVAEILTQQLSLLTEDEFDLILSQCDESDLDPGAFAPDPASPTTSKPTSKSNPQLESHVIELRASARELASPSPQQPTCSRFATPKSATDVQAAQANAVARNTMRTTNWALNVWKDWTAHRRKVCSPVDCPPHLYICKDVELDFWLSRFVLEIRRQDGQPYPPQTLYSIVCGLMRYLRELHPKLNLFKDVAFAGFHRTLDGEMKRLRSLGIGVQKKRAEPISIDEEGKLWEQKLLGETDPHVLLDTMVFMCGLYFALRSGKEHRDLTTSQIVLVTPSDGTPYLTYTENVSKNNRGGMAQRKLEAKRVVHHANISNPARCFVALYQAYLKHWPANKTCEAFYLTPLKKPKGDVWYSNVPVGHNTLAKTVKRLCERAGISGFKTNHSLRVTSATRLFQSGVEEQLIMSRTGHRSVEGVRTYKRTSTEQKEALSKVLNSATNGESKPSLLPVSSNDLHEPAQKKFKAEETPQLTNLNFQGHRVPPQMNFSGCSSITINYNVKSD